MRRPRHLSAEERALWDSVAKQAKPLKTAKRDLAATAPSPLPAGERSTPKVSGEGTLRRAMKSPLAPPLSPAGRENTQNLVVSASPRNALERRERARLKRGQRDIDARLDLHGMTQARAHRALLVFLQRAQDDGCRYVLVITGKGKMSAEGVERGVLRRLVPEWFGLAKFRLLIVSFEEAGIGHGGEGALYVRVRRG